MKLGSLFDGSGGFPLAGSLCGIEPVWAAEIEPYPIAVTRSRFPNMKHLGDISKINGAEIEPVDIITFGSPCQDLSIAGKRAGLKHEGNGDEETTRSGLFMEAVRIIKEMREATNGVYPRFALWENVPGAFSSNKGEDFRIVLEELIKIVEAEAEMPPVPKGGWPYADCYLGDGWSLAYRVFDAQYWGVPQRRRRIYLVTDFAGQCAGEVSFERDGLRGYFAEGGTPWESLAEDAERSLGTADCEADSVIPYTLKIRSGCEGGGKGALIQTDMSATLSTLNDQYLFQPILDDQGGSQISVRYDGKCPTLRAEMHGNIPCVMEAAGFCPEQSAKTRGIGYEEEESPTLRAGVTPAVCIKEVLPFDTTQVTSPMNYSNPKWGDPCHPLAASAHHPAVVVRTWDARGNGDGVTCNTITGDYNNRVTDYTTCVCVAHGQANAEICENLSPTLNCNHEQPIVVFDKEVYQSGRNAAGGHYIAEGGPAPTLRATGHPPGVSYCVDCRNATEYPETTGTLQADCYKNLNSNGVVRIQYIVRRLTPTECARLQGFADGWGIPDHKNDLTNEEYEFWLDVRNTHEEINGKTTKPYTKDQMLKWYNKLHTDSSEYKMWGNGIALPTALYVMQGIADVLN